MRGVGKKNVRELRNGCLHCPLCNQWKELDEFPDAKKGGYGKFTYCKLCRKEYSRMYDYSPKRNAYGTKLTGPQLRAACNLALFRWSMRKQNKFLEANILGK